MVQCLSHNYLRAYKNKRGIWPYQGGQERLSWINDMRPHLLWARPKFLWDPWAATHHFCFHPQTRSWCSAGATSTSFSLSGKHTCTLRRNLEDPQHRPSESSKAYLGRKFWGPDHLRCHLIGGLTGSNWACPVRQPSGLCRPWEGHSGGRVLGGPPKHRAGLTFDPVQGQNVKTLTWTLKAKPVSETAVQSR